MVVHHLVHQSYYHEIQHPSLFTHNPASRITPFIHPVQILRPLTFYLCIPSLPIPLQARYGPSKMLINTLNKKYLAEEVIQQQQQPPAPIVTSGSSDDSNSMEVAYDHSNLMMDSKDDHQGQIEDNSLKELEELFCATCGDVHTSLRNQLVECCDCHLLYHQDCHKPVILDADAKSDWQCSKCRSSLAVSESVLTSSSSTSSSPTVFATMKTTSSSSSPHSSSSSKSGGGGHRKSGGGGSSGSTSKSSKSGSGSGSSNILSADKRLANMKKKAKMQKTKWWRRRGWMRGRRSNSCLEPIKVMMINFLITELAFCFDWGSFHQSCLLLIWRISDLVGGLLAIEMERCENEGI